MRVEAENGTKEMWSASMWRPRIPNCFLASTTMLRPSGVSSDREASWAASASCWSSTPGAGRNSFAMRLPKVMVPVLSSISTSMSPAASTARPDVASTFRRTSRSMPLMPMALSRPPIVVGIRHTSRETRMGREIWPSALKPSARAESSMYPAMAGRENTTTRKTMVSATSRMLSAISLGVFCRLAPSTMAIIRSRKVLPGSAVMRMTMPSLITRVPPVTALRSPPLSRMTGADSPVIADSSTLAMPSITSPSSGMTSPASHSTLCPLRSSETETISSVPLSVRRRAFT